MPVLKIEWKCPKCGAKPGKHGTGGETKCAEGYRGTGPCTGFICECPEDAVNGHGQVFDNPCHEANCYHCGWGGTFPRKPKGLMAWEQKALKAGWVPPASRRMELGL